MPQFRPAAPLLLAALLVSHPAMAQESDTQLWLQANGTTRLDADTRLTAEAIARFGDAADGIAHSEIGAVITRALGESVSVQLGYRHVQPFERGDTLANEERLRQVVTVALGGGFSTRLRLEQRFSSAGGAVGVRLRGQLRFEQPLDADGLALFATHESFANLNGTGWGQQAGYERMRHTLGLSIPLSDTIEADAGYLTEYRFGRDGDRDRILHAAALTLNLDL